MAFELLVIGMASGALGALLGVGGGVILVPALSLLAGLELRAAVGTSLVAVVATSVAGSVVYLRQGLVDVPVAVELQFFAAFGAVGAGLLAPLVPEPPLYFLFALLLLFTASRMWPKRPPANAVDEPVVRHRHLVGAGASLSAGIVAGLLGVGGGILNTPLLHLIFALPFRQAAATSVYIIGITGCGAAMIYLIRGDVGVGIAAVTMLGAMIGAGGVALVGHRVRQRTLVVGFSLLLVFVAIQMVRRGIASI